MQKTDYIKLEKTFNEVDGNEYYKFMDKWRGKISNIDDIFYIFSRALLYAETIKSNNLLKDNKSIEILFNRIDSRYSDIIKNARDIFNENQLKSIILNFDTQIKSRMRGMDTGIYIPKGLRDLSYNLLKIKDRDKVLHPYCMDGDFIMDYLIKFPKNYICGLDVRTDSILKSQIKASIFSEDRSKIKFIQGEYINSDLSNINCNKIFSIPPFMVSYLQEIVRDKELINFYKKNGFKSYSDWIYLLKATLNPNFERAVFVVHSNILFNKRDTKIREYLADKGLIETIIELPAKIFFETGITTYLIVLSKDNKSIKMVDASEMYKKETKINIIDENNLSNILKAYNEKTDKSRDVSFEELSENDYSFLVKRYTTKELNLENYVYLKDVAEIRRGYANIKQEDLKDRLSNENTNYKLLTAGDISDEFSIDTLSSLTNIEDSEAIYCIEDKEIAITRGGNYKSILITKDDERILTNGTLYIIDCDENKMNPYYLQMYLSSDHCLNQIESLTVGSVISFMSISQLGELKIPIVSKEHEIHISEKYKSILDRYEIIRLQKKSLQDEYSDILSEVI